MQKKTIYIELDNVLCNYSKRCFELKAELDIYDEDELPIHYKDILPIDDAIEAFKEISNKMEAYIVTTDNKKEEKIEWVRNYLPAAADRIIFGKTDDIGKGDYLVCLDEGKAGDFPGEVIEYYSFDFPSWYDVIQHLAAKEDGVEETCTCDQDEESVKRSLVTKAKVERTIAQLDNYMKILNAKYEEQGDKETFKEIIEVAELANYWLKVAGENDESKYYDI